MSVGRFLALGVIALVPLCSGVAPVDAQGKHPASEVSRSGIVGGACGDDLCADVWKFVCNHATTLHADVTDTGLPLSDVLTVTLVGNTPGSIKGRANVQVTSAGGTTPAFAEIAKGVEGTISGFAIVTSSTGETGYTVDLHCHGKDGTQVEPVSVKLIQDEQQQGQPE